MTAALSINTLQAIQADAEKTSPYHVEVIDGNPVQKPLPKRLHQIIQQRIYDLLRSTCPETFEVYQELNYICGGQLFIPDVVVCSAGAKYDNGDLVEPPALVVEVLSPGQTVGQLYDKCLACLSDGVQDAWIVAPRGAGYLVKPDGTLLKEEVLRTIVGDLTVEVKLAHLNANLPDDLRGFLPAGPS
jgi:Uma2 family endonuclease